MKLLGWMHRKFKQNSSETPKEFSFGFSGQPSLDDLQSYQKGGYGGKPFTKAHRDMYRRNSFTSLEAAREEEEDLEEEERATALTELFHGFLHIGTLGTEPVITDVPPTPTFSISVDHIAEKETKVTENELKLINDELEKVLAAEGDSCNLSSGRNSHVSAGRISHCSVITLSGKPPLDNAESGSEATICPLQSYLFGSAIGMQETTTPPVQKEQRTSLGELFQKTKQAEEKRAEKETEKSAVHAMKKMLKRKISSNPTTAETKLNKILQMFNRKVHPENSTCCSQNHNPTKNEMKRISGGHVMEYSNGGLRPSAEDIIIYPHQARENMLSYKNNQSQNATKAGGDELWVKTDADYLVLEL
ncbi:protein LAZY 1-like [Salvia splendens]|uniref:protein LAZY 1-like n=1 Tax=Salvia splendens TaxID=180675 RepID=UPI00110171B0|nr:protein LAZY 1-like [Salvia splendens]